jgi:hypothetical protein
MKKALGPFVGIMLAMSAASCAGAAEDEGGGEARVTIERQTFDVNHTRISYEIGDDGYFRVEGDDAAHPTQDCVPGVPGRLALYGDLPSTVTTLADLAGRELPFEFTGDGDDANLYFVGSNGLLGVKTGTVRFSAVEGTKVTFSFTGSFTMYDGQGGEAPSEVNASGSGIAHAVTN